MHSHRASNSVDNKGFCIVVEYKEVHPGEELEPAAVHHSLCDTRVSYFHGDDVVDVDNYGHVHTHKLVDKVHLPFDAVYECSHPTSLVLQENFLSLKIWPPND